jgi:hypothetical protein
VNRYTILAAATMALALTVTPAVAQDSHDLTGTWVLSAEASDFGRSPAPDSATMVIERADDRLVMRRDLYSEHAGGHRYYTYDMPTDGGFYPAVTTDGEQEMQVSWDHGVLVVVTEAQSNVGPIGVTDRFRLDDDGQQLVIDRSLDVPGMGPMEMTIVYVKMS